MTAVMEILQILTSYENNGMMSPHHEESCTHIPVQQE
jgi:hypothetical protein